MVRSADRASMPRAVLIVLGLIAALVLALSPAAAVDEGAARERGGEGTRVRGGDLPGVFDFYVIALSWSPSYCEAEGDKRGDDQCARPFSFVLHGLWPQFERGFPANCKTDAGRLPERLIRDQLDFMPAFGLVIHQWRKHGTCSGLLPEAYFQAARRAFDAIVIPPDYRQPTEARMVDIAAVERDFLAANQGLEPEAIAVTCDGRRLREVRVCMRRDLSGFTPCPDVDARACRRDRIFMPAIRVR